MTDAAMVRGELCTAGRADDDVDRFSDTKSATAGCWSDGGLAGVSRVRASSSFLSRACFSQVPAKST